MNTELINIVKTKIVEQGRKDYSQIRFEFELLSDFEIICWSYINLKDFTMAHNIDLQIDNEIIYGKLCIVSKHSNDVIRITHNYNFKNLKKWNEKT